MTEHALRKYTSVSGTRPGRDKGANAVWTYEQPYPAVAEIAGHLAFYPVVEVTEEAVTE